MIQIQEHAQHTLRMKEATPMNLAACIWDMVRCDSLIRWPVMICSCCRWRKARYRSNIGMDRIAEDCMHAWLNEDYHIYGTITYSLHKIFAHDGNVAAGYIVQILIGQRYIDQLNQ